MDISLSSSEALSLSLSLSLLSFEVTLSKITRILYEMLLLALQISMCIKSLIKWIIITVSCKSNFPSFGNRNRIYCWVAFSITLTINKLCLFPPYNHFEQKFAVYECYNPILHEFIFRKSDTSHGSFRNHILSLAITKFRRHISTCLKLIIVSSFIHNMKCKNCHLGEIFMVYLCGYMCEWCW